MVKVAQEQFDGNRGAWSVSWVQRLQRKSCTRILAMTVCAFSFGVSAGSAEAVELTAGDVPLSGEIIRATGSTVMFKLDVGRIINVARKDISSVRIPMQDGTEAEGSLLQWQDGIYVIGIGDQKIYIQDGQVDRVEDPEPATEVAVETPAEVEDVVDDVSEDCLLYTSPSPRDQRGSRMPSSA